MLNYKTRVVKDLILPVFSVLIFSFVTTATAAQDTSQRITAGRVNSPEQQDKPYVILISADGFRYDLADKYDAVNLKRLRDTGIQAAYMQPSFPSLTFPNHYTIITGMYPAHHGLLDNSFLDEKRHAVYNMGNKLLVADSSWYSGVPLWVLAEQQQMLSASFYWVASEAAILGKRPTYYYLYNEKIEIDTRINIVKNWLQLPIEQRPHFITFYFPQVDHAAHVYGPDAPETAAAVHFVDESIGKLTDSIATLQLPVNFIFVSDHGMTNVNAAETLPLPQAVDTTEFYVPPGDALLHLYAKKRQFILPSYKALKKQAGEFDVYLANNTPKRWHYRKKDDWFKRNGDILLVAKPPKVFSITGKHTTPGKHGFDPMLPDMRASFYAWGPAFRQGLHINGFENIHVYPLIATILGLHYIPRNIDGRLSVLQPVLQ